VEPESSRIGIDDDYPGEKYFFGNMNKENNCISIEILSKYLQLRYCLFSDDKIIFFRRGNH